MEDIEEQCRQDEIFFDEQKEKYLIMLQAISKLNNEEFIKNVVSKIEENLQKLPDIEKIIHISALALASAELGIVDISFADEMIKHLKSGM